MRLKLAELYPLPGDWLKIARDATLVAGAINLQGAALTVWFNILDYAFANGLTQMLRNAIEAEYPSCADLWLAYMEELEKGERPNPELPGASTDDRVNTARSGFDEVNKQSRDIQAELGSRSELETVTALIDTLATYKNLHDSLQSFQYGIGSFKTLILAARLMDTDLEQVRVLRKFLKELKLFCIQIGQHVAALPQGPTLRDIEQVWLDDLDAAAGKLQVAIDAKSSDAYDALYEVQRILRVIPSRLNQQIFVTAKTLPFATLANGLSAIAKKLADNASAVTVIDAARDSILVLSSTIHARVIEHKLWQEVDHKLADLTDMIEPADGKSGPAANAVPFQFSPLWRNLALKVQTLSDLDAGSPWRAMLATYATGVNDQLTREVVDSAFILAFEAYRDEAQQRFVLVDLALKNECDSLTRISEPLHKILEELE
nr:hypothetical protein [uncultured Shinella sp.]